MIKSSSKQGTDRRNFLRSLGGLGAATVGAIAVTWTDSPAAEASGRRRGYTPAYTVGCCGLATSTPCGGSWDNGNFTCPSGYSKEYWGCCVSGDVQYICWECKHRESDNTSSCFSGDLEDYICSNWTSRHVSC